MKRPSDAHRANVNAPGLPAPADRDGDLDIAIIAQLPPPQFVLGDKFERVRCR
jgi:hypothetical protein